MSLLVLLSLLVSPARAAVAGEDLARPFLDLPSDFEREADPEGLIALGLSGLASAVARPDDPRVKEAVLSSRPIGNRAATEASMAGEGYVLVPVALGSYLAGKQWDKEGPSRFGELALEGLVVSQAETEVLKLSVGRLRPDGSDRHSFPSGHASASFSIAAAAQETWGWHAGVPAYAGAGLIAYSRLEKNKHWLSDVVFGMGLGIASGRAVARAHGKNGSKTSWRLMIVPGGATVAVRFQ